ncbi:acyl-CoA dehydrogenase family protein [Pseudomonas sp. F1_0610]|uniref:acyl-CoA dehydrogenase family protein n=1 Tax=Pseudomonas sp. F1_0610 TaxID=3114284 RepID=UPI0039C06E61
MSAHNDELKMLAESVQRFIEQHISPVYETWETNHLIPKAFWRTLGEAGLLGMDMPEEYGGSAADIHFPLQIIEQFGLAGFGGLNSAYNIHANIVMPYILHIGNPAQKQQWLPRLISGEAIGAIAMTEPSAGSDLAAMRTSAVRNEKGWLLNGSKTFITNGINADVVIVCAKTNNHAGAKGISLFLVDTQLKGFSRGQSIEKIGQHCSDTAELFFDNLQLSNDALLGECDKGFMYLMQELPRERLGVAAQALGAMQGALNITVDYVQQRKAFGQSIAQFQNTRFVLAQIKADIEMARSYLQQCITHYQAQTMDTTEAAVLKLQLTEMQCRISDQCLQLFGGYGYTREYPISRFYADARVQTIYAGSSEIMKEIIARSMLGKA